VANPNDARGKLVMLTAKGSAALRDSNRVKREIEARYRSVLGEGDFTVFMTALEKLGGEGG
jgi:DNA-binding MarR family transcriptional regulator